MSKKMLSICLDFRGLVLLIAIWISCSVIGRVKATNPFMNDTATTPAVQLTDIVPNERYLFPSRDQPGQRRVYILPDDPRRETYRLSTYQEVPQTVPVNECRLASSGFYYTGFGDRVKCFSCGQAADNWLIGDDVTLPQWHKPDCDYIHRRETGNVPIASLGGRTFCINTGANRNQPRNHFISTNAVASTSNATRRNFPVNAATTLRRRVLYNPSTRAATSQLRGVQSEPRSLRNGANHVNGAPEIRDPRTNIKNQEKTNEELVSFAQKMGFDNAAIREVIERKYETSNQSFSSFESFVEALVALPDKDILNELNEEEAASAENQTSPLSTSNLSTVAGIEEMQTLEESRLCKMCKSKPSCVVFIPCGHLSTCFECSKKVLKCPICKTVIQKKVRSDLF